MIKRLTLDRKIKDNGNKLYINVYNLMKHQREYYREIHQDNGKLSAKQILKSKDFKVILTMYNNDVIGYIDLKRNERPLEIYNLYIKDEVINKEEVIYQMLYLITKENNGNIVFDVEENSEYYQIFLNLGFK